MSKPSAAKHQLSRISPLSIMIVLLFAAAMTYFLIRSFAASGTATLYTSPAGTQSVTNGQTFSVNVRISSGANVPVTGASVYLSYPSNLLQVTGESYAGSPYSTQLVASDSGGLLRMDRAAFPMIAGGDQLFAQVSFKAVATGSAAISFSGSSIVTSGEDDSNILTQRTGVTYNIAAPATTPPPPSSGGGGSSSGSGGGSSGSSSGSSGGTKTPTSGQSTGNPKSTTTGSGSSASTGSGSSGSSGSTTGSTGSGTSSGGASTTGETSDTSTVDIAVLDSQSKPIEGAEVVINGQTAKTDKNGIAHFSSVAVGKQSVTIKYQGKKTSKDLQVKSVNTKSPQLFKVSVTRNKFNPTLLLVPVIVLVVAGAFFVRPWDKWFAPSFAADGASQVHVVSSNEPAVPAQPLSGPSPHNANQRPGAVVAPQPPSSSGDSTDSVRQPPDNSQP